MLQVIQKGKQKIQQRRTTPEALRLGSTVSVSNYVIPDFLPRIKEAYPEVNVKLTTATTDQLIAKLLGQEIDLAFVRKVMHPAIRTVAFTKIRYSYTCTEGILSLKAGMSAWRRSGMNSWSFRMWLTGLASDSPGFDSLEHPPDITYHVDNSETAKNWLCRGGHRFSSRVNGEEGGTASGTVPDSGP